MQARFFDPATATCTLCPRTCHIPPGSAGFCGVRENIDGTLVTRTYGFLTACGIDPIEKKPLNHFLPGSSTLSISSFGCNMTCRHCQNHTLSQSDDAETVAMPAEEVVRLARRHHASSISFTYNEPTVFYEYMHEVAALAHTSGIKTAVITNGYMSEDACRDLIPCMDAFRIDLKAFSDRFYQDICGGAHLQPVLDTICRVKESGRHLELVTLIIPGVNDAADELDAMLAWELDTLGPCVPHHFTAFTPMYKMTDVRAATHADMDAVFQRAKSAGLAYPYVGNVIHAEGSTTYCPHCGSRLILRAGYVCRTPGLSGGVCSVCGRKLEGVF